LTNTIYSGPKREFVLKYYCEQIFNWLLLKI